MKLLDELRDWVDARALRAVDWALADFIHQQTGSDDAALLLAVALLSERNGHGHVCLDLQQALQAPEQLLTGLSERHEAAIRIRQALLQRLAALTLPDWVARLQDSTAVCPCGPGQEAGVAQDSRPLVLQCLPGRPPLLYLRRYWQYEHCIRQQLQQRLQQPPLVPVEATRRLLQCLFPRPATDRIDWQQLACALVVRQSFGIITGGPGTGKTHTVLNLLALLQGLQLSQGLPPLVLRLAAPTGKAAARLNEALSGKLAALPLQALPDLITAGQVADWRAALPTQVTTLHRLLGVQPGTRHFRHHAGHPLAADLVVVDEASMVDVDMMASLLDALRPDTRLILLGDKDQLASVEAGAVLGDLCAGAAEGHYDDATLDWLQQVTGCRLPEIYRGEGRPLQQATALLRHSYRFQAEGGIGGLARLVNEGVVAGQPVADRLQALKQLMQQGKTSASGRIELLQPAHVSDPLLRQRVVDGLKPCLTLARQVPETPAAVDTWATAVLQSQSGFQLLTALRQGDWGVEGINQRVREWLVQAGLLPETSHQWYAGRPVLVTRNNYSLKLMNGDLGMALMVPVQTAEGAWTQQLRVAFPAGDGSGGVRWMLPSRLQAVETVFAMTVHKSQGSEFTHALLVLPDKPNPVLTRELLYTGITRARDVFTLVCSRDEVLRSALEQQVLRTSGLRF